MLDRREFLAGAASFGVLLSLPEQSRADLSMPAVNFTVDPSQQLGRMPLDFVGLSYETSDLIDIEQFSPNNKQLITLFQRLHPVGVLRIGGNSGDRADWYTYVQPDSSIDITQPLIQPIDPMHPTTPPPMPKMRPTVSPDMLFNLSGFMAQSGWSLIWQLNMKSGSLYEARDEARAVAHAVGPRLLAFEIGNEPDLYGNLGGVAWNYDRFLQAWTDYAAAIKQAVPTARFSGPDTTFISGWPNRFSKDASGLSILTGHYYPDGPASNPAVTPERVLRLNPKFDNDLRGSANLAQKAGLTFRVTEANSCWGGGRPGVSDSYASTLWAADYLLRAAQAGYAGLCLHGGAYRVYAPIVGSSSNGYQVRPVYYGIFFASQFSQSQFVSVSTDSPTVNVNGFAAQTDGGWLFAAVNKDLQESYAIQVRGIPGVQAGKAWRLHGMDPTNGYGITLAGDEITSDGSWTARAVEDVDVSGGSMQFGLPAASAVLIYLS